MVKIAPTILTAILAILSQHAAADAQSIAELNFAKIRKRVNAKTFVTRHSPVRHGRNTVDATCEADTDAVNDIEEVSNAYEQVDNDLGDPDCEEDSATCTLDFASYTAELTDVCESNGGKTYITGFKISCSGDEFTGELVAKNLALCVGLSCSEDDLDEVFDSLLEDLEDHYASDFEADCEAGPISSSGETTSSSGAVRVAFAISTAIISTGLFLL